LGILGENVVDFVDFVDFWWYFLVFERRGYKGRGVKDDGGRGVVVSY